MEIWPALPYREWRDTCTNLQLRSQIVGKIRLAQTPWINHSWHVTLYVTGRGLTTGPIPYQQRAFQIDFDFIEHQLSIRLDDGRMKSMPLVEQTIADFYAKLFALLEQLELRIQIVRTPNEVSNPIPFDTDTEHRAYDAQAAQRFWRALVQIDRRIHAVSQWFSRQGQSGALFLGKLRSCGNPFLRAARSVSGRKYTGTAGRGRAGGLFSRSEQCRLLARG